MVKVRDVVLCPFHCYECDQIIEVAQTTRVEIKETRSERDKQAQLTEL